jgi:hypothetical protein
MIEAGGNFLTTPEARTNAVTVWYADGTHVDLAIHRIATNIYGSEELQHAGTSWTARDPEAITGWFKQAVKDKSPSKDWGATVEKGQMRKVVRLLKKFSKAYPSLVLPGGFIISVLVAERYVPDYHRDDIALYQTMLGIHSRLQGNLQVYNPCNHSSLTDKDKYLKQVERFRDRLELAIGWLQPLFDPDCTVVEAANAWNNVFNHEYWVELRIFEEAVMMGEAHRSAPKGFISSTGLVTPTPIAGKSIEIPKHRFYGDL